LVAPDLVDIEVLSAWRRMVAAGALDERRADLAIADLRMLRLDRVPNAPLLERCWQLRSKLTMYDAAYIALAETTGLGVLTADSKLAAAPGLGCEIELLS
jgi:predicted nucleic acid-binding protein